MPRRTRTKTTQRNIPSLTVLEMIAKEHLLVDNLTERNVSSLDFHDCSVVGIKRALEAAYELGRQDGARSK